MHKSTLLRMFQSIVVFLTLLAVPVCFAGAHGGGGGFHGGGGGGFHGGGGGGYHGGWGGGGGYHGASAGSAYHGGGYHGSGYYRGGYHGGGYYRGGGYYGGYRGGYYPARGWYGGGWGYPGWGWGGWGFGIGVSFGWGGYGGWGGYWPAYPYSAYPYYGYAPACSAYYPCYPYYSSPYPYYAPVSGQPAAPTAYVNTAPAEQPAPAQYNTPESRTVPMPPRSSAVTVMNASYRPGTSSHTVTSYQSPSHTSPQISELSPAVQNVIRALRAMPPAARQRQLASGRYNDFSPQEMKFVRYAADVPATR